MFHVGSARMRIPEERAMEVVGIVMLSSLVLYMFQQVGDL
jgi:hypothetical protein